MKLETYLVEQNIKHADFAKAIGVSQAAVTRYAKGRRVPRPSILAKIVQATNGQVSIESLLYSDAVAE